jgi:3-hydroxy-9,10-secoandrosta-1,3,5(10)-triene-9,17-dione monooxygenase reductase component
MGSIKDAMSCFTTGVTVVTTHFEGQDWGMTCNSFNTVSLEPPMVLWSVNKKALSHRAFTQSSGYLVNILRVEQKDLAMRFATGTQAERFETEHLVRESSQRMRLEHSLAWFDCKLERVIDVGDHHVLIGLVERFGSDSGVGLAVAQRQMGQLSLV